MSHQLCSAAERGDLEKVRALLDAGVDVDWHSKSRGMTALWEAANAGHQDVVRLLIERGANINHAPPANGMTPLHLACSRADAAMVGLLLQSGGDPNRGTTGWNITPLMTSAQMGCVDIVQPLLDAGADPEAVAKDGRTALSMAEQKRHAEVIALLQKVGTPQARKSTKTTPLVWPPLLEKRGKEDAPETVLFGFIHAMNRWEKEAARLFKANGQDFTDESLQALRSIFSEYCTPRARDRPYGRNGSFQTPPEYDPAREDLLEVRPESPRRVVLVTRSARLNWRYRYVLLKQKGRWFLDSKKISHTEDGEADWGDWSL